MSQNDTSLALLTSTWALKALARAIDKYESWWNQRSQSDRDYLLVLKDLEKRIRKHQACLGEGARKRRAIE